MMLKENRKFKTLAIPVLVIMLVAGIALNVWAEEQKDKEKSKPKPIPVFLGRTDIFDGKIPKKIFDSLLKQGLTSKDSLGRAFKVDGFLLTYGERNLYEDSIGRPLVITDLLSEVCYGDTLRRELLENILDRSKAGDTVYFDQITVISPEGKGAHGRGMRLIIGK
jgi:hypothetical protein